MSGSQFGIRKVSSLVTVAASHSRPDGKLTFGREERDGGMGGTHIHGLYTIDFTNPKFAWDSVVLMADSFSGVMLGGVRRSRLIGSRLKLTTEVRFGCASMRDMAGSSCAPTMKPNVCPYRRSPAMTIDFRLVGAVFKVTPDTATAAMLFGVR